MEECYLGERGFENVRWMEPLDFVMLFMDLQFPNT
jgi:hypothetical protein